jgi:hypothetical protein
MFYTNPWINLICNLDCRHERVYCTCTVALTSGLNADGYELQNEHLFITEKSWIKMIIWMKIYFCDFVQVTLRIYDSWTSFKAMALRAEFSFESNYGVHPSTPSNDVQRVGVQVSTTRSRRAYAHRRLHSMPVSVVTCPKWDRAGIWLTYRTGHQSLALLSKRNSHIGARYIMLGGCFLGTWPRQEAPLHSNCNPLKCTTCHAQCAALTQ